jgi:AcrR family transcriptional regulator
MSRSRSERVRRQVLDAVVELIDEGGVDTVTMEGVAARSGVAKTTVYRHWPTRSALIVDAVRSCWAHLVTPDTGALRTDLRAAFATMQETELGPVSRMMPSLLAAAMRDPELDRLTRTLGDERKRPIIEMFERAQDRGELSADVDLDLAFGVVLGPLVFRKVNLREPISDEYLDGVIEVAIAGLNAVAAAADRQVRPARRRA